MLALFFTTPGKGLSMVPSMMMVVVVRRAQSTTKRPTGCAEGRVFQTNTELLI